MPSELPTDPAFLRAAPGPNHRNDLDRAERGKWRGVDRTR